MKQKSLFSSGDSNRDPNRKNGYMRAAAEESRLALRGAYSPYFGIPGEKLVEDIIDKIMTMLVSGFNHKYSIADVQVKGTAREFQ